MVVVYKTGRARATVGDLNIMPNLALKPVRELC